MSTRKQHFVPRVYMKAWETTVETEREPNKKFTGIYVFQNTVIGEGTNRNSVLWKPHLYTINFANAYNLILRAKIKDDFANKIFELLRINRKTPVYGKYGYSIIKTKRSIEKHIDQISEWKFYYDDGNIAPESAIRNQIDELNCYLLEECFDEFFEKKWEKILENFIEGVHDGNPVGIGHSERIIPMDVAFEMLSAFFIMLCRNPRFDAMGVYTRIKNNLLYPILISMMQENNGEEPTADEVAEGREYIDNMMNAIWYSELYRMFYGSSKGFYHNAVSTAMTKCQMILFEAYDDAGFFITSDNPAFENNSVVENENLNGMILPLTPKYMLFIANGNQDINVVDHRFANKETIKKFNGIIMRNKTEKVIAISKNLYDAL